MKINPLYIAPLVLPNQILKSKNRKLKITTIKDILILFTLLVFFNTNLKSKMLSLKALNVNQHY